MFANCDELKEKAREVVKSDRMLYWPFLDYVEKFAAANGCYLAGDLAVARLTGVCGDGFCDASYELYCDNVFPTGQRLADELYRLDSPFLDRNTVVLQTVLKHRELTLSINARLLVRLYGMERIRGRRLPFVLPNGPYLPVEYLLVSVYRRLYTPANVDDWDAAHKLENTLFEKWDGAHQIVSPQTSSVPNAQRAILTHLKKGTLGILAGDYGLCEITPCETRRLQFISNMEPEDIAKLLRSILVKASLAHNVTKVTFVENHLVCFSDPQLKQLTFYAENSGSPGFALCDVWNSTSYEMIPTANISGTSEAKVARVAHVLVLMKLFFVDMWVAMINGRKITDTAICNVRLARQQIQTEGRPAVDSYLGQIITDRAAKKRQIGDEQRLPDYLPATQFSQ